MLELMSRVIVSRSRPRSKRLINNAVDNLLLANGAAGPGQHLCRFRPPLERAQRRVALADALQQSGFSINTVDIIATLHCGGADVELRL
jgi:dihydroorotase-like cyclic amidohydrolase